MRRVQEAAYVVVRCLHLCFDPLMQQSPTGYSTVVATFVATFVIRSVPARARVSNVRYRQLLQVSRS